ncbi:MAG TPA: DUF3365 domain-containing protein [Oligoflexus sp.]|uniref:Tll0287-like domain-containing protein n=1 Tax=Oligoflexus sp. TaxID=1971216 RepID=UPI002D4B6DCC|nr:DUF3365 domain-containing protein [Oligoflexus sp.]HYX32442.1 DUF3365 domain-containing protein [Oligoflexus sp.]
MPIKQTFVLTLAFVASSTVPFSMETASAAECKVAGASQEFLIRMADSIRGVIQADRSIYAEHVVTRLVDNQGAIKASEQWKDEKGTLPLPAQMLRMGSEHFAKNNKGISYSLLSTFPINKQNSAKTESEKKGLLAVAQDPTKNYYDCETLGKKSYFTAIYADVAVSKSCVSCHNKHKDSPKKDFKLNDVMGGVTIRIAAD